MLVRLEVDEWPLYSILESISPGVQLVCLLFSGGGGEEWICNVIQK